MLQFNKKYFFYKDFAATQVVKIIVDDIRYLYDGLSYMCVFWYTTNKNHFTTQQARNETMTDAIVRLISSNFIHFLMKYHQFIT